MVKLMYPGIQIRLPCTPRTNFHALVPPESETKLFKKMVWAMRNGNPLYYYREWGGGGGVGLQIQFYIGFYLS